MSFKTVLFKTEGTECVWFRVPCRTFVGAGFVDSGWDDYTVFVRAPATFLAGADRAKAAQRIVRAAVRSIQLTEASDWTVGKPTRVRREAVCCGYGFSTADLNGQWVDLEPSQG